MKKFSVVALAMTATLALGACSAEDEPEETTTSEESADEGTEETSDEAAETGDMGGATDDAAAETGDAADQTEAAGEFSEPACNEFFTEGGPLADRAEAARSALDAGEVADDVAYSEVMLLKSRLDATAEEAPEDISALITTVNAPFAEVVDLVNEGSVVDPEAGTITLPEIDTQASADAQAELETVCAG